MRVNESKREEMTETPVSFAMEKGMLAKIDKLAESWDRSRAWVIRKLLGDGLAAQSASPGHLSPREATNHTALSAQ
jgi:predicted transcriptional regulator